MTASKRKCNRLQANHRLNAKNSIKPAAESLPLWLHREEMGSACAKWRENDLIPYKIQAQRKSIALREFWQKNRGRVLQNSRSAVILQVVKHPIACRWLHIMTIIESQRSGGSFLLPGSIVDARRNAPGVRFGYAVVLRLVSSAFTVSAARLPARKA